MIKPQLRFVLAAGLAAGLLAATGTAQAYPQWQFSSGTARCSQCHYNPAGGGLINGYGRDAAGEELSTWEGDGAFAHGAIELPKALALGFDGRFAVMTHDVGEVTGSAFAYFPMQADVALRVAFTDSISLYGSAGYRGQARNQDEPLGAGAAQPAGGSRFISREHFLMWRPAALGPYVRAGRFFAPFGLRLAEHYTYVRRDTGYNLLEESYSVSLGWVKNSWELHLTGFGPDVVRYLGSTERGGVGMVEVRVGEATALGADVRVGMTDERYRYTGGVFGKTYFEGAKSLIQTELNLVHSTFAGSTETTQGFVGYLGITFFPGTGFWITPYAERVQNSIAVRNSATNGAGLQLNWFPLPHWEIVGMGRFQAPAGDSTAMTALLFLHYYL
jgi:hypothetical protein